MAVDSYAEYQISRSEIKRGDHAARVWRGQSGGAAEGVLATVASQRRDVSQPKTERWPRFAMDTADNGSVPTRSGHRSSIALVARGGREVRLQSTPSLACVALTPPPDCHTLSLHVGGCFTINKAAMIVPAIRLSSTISVATP